VVENHGGDLEGHTPRGFQGSGIGLFVGDNLNSRFPDGDGVQTFLSFDVPPGLGRVTSATLRSDVMSLTGTPFADLGNINVEPVTYDEFGPPIFDLPAEGPSIVCLRVGDSGLECDVTAAASASGAAHGGRLQLRMFFDVAGDNDNSPDLALFFLTDSNTNEPGIFTLEMNNS
jgi:hypothetical protein